jgi:hypothetical protein
MSTADLAFGALPLKIVALPNKTSCIALPVAFNFWQPHTFMSIFQINTNLEHCQPRLTASLRPGCVRIRCERNGAPALRLQMRYHGTPWYTLLEACDSDHVEDRSPVEIPGCEELREYRAIAVCDGEEVGHPSDIVKVVLPG